MHHVLLICCVWWRLKQIIMSKRTDCSYPLVLQLCSAANQDAYPSSPPAGREKIAPCSCEGGEEEVSHHTCKGGEEETSHHTCTCDGGEEETSHHTCTCDGGEEEISHYTCVWRHTAVRLTSPQSLPPACKWFPVLQPVLLQSHSSLPAVPSSPPRGSP